MLRIVVLVCGLALVGGAAAYGIVQARTAPPERLVSAAPGPLSAMAALARTLADRAPAPAVVADEAGTLAAAQSWVWAMAGGSGSAAADSAPASAAAPVELPGEAPSAAPEAPVVRVHAGLPGGGGSSSGVTVNRGLP